MIHGAQDDLSESCLGGERGRKGDRREDAKGRRLRQNKSKSRSRKRKENGT